MAQKRSLIGRLLAPTRRGRKLFRRDENGAVAIEFALLAFPFFTLIFAILETSVVFLAGQILDSAVQDASRKIRTGQPEAATAALFNDEICDRLFNMFDCDQLKVKVSVVATFAAATIASPIDPDCEGSIDPDDCGWTSEFVAPTYSAGGATDIILVQAYYKWPTIVNLPGFNLATQAGNTRLLSAVRVFRNEPF
jgi:Flp pilus assembly protein TadG